MDDAGAALMTASRTPDFSALFHALPSPHMVLDRSLRYVDANPAYCVATERRREELIGRHVFDLFPNDGPGGLRLRHSFEQVLATGRPHSLPLLPYPIPRPQSRGGGFELRYWSAVHTPLPGPDGDVAFIVQNTVDVTELQQLKQIAYGAGGRAPAPGETDLFQRAREVEAANEALLQESQGLRDLFLQAPGFMAVLTGPELRFTLVNAAYQQLIGHRPVIGLPIREALPEVVAQGIPELIDKVVREGEAYVGRANRIFLQRSLEGPPEERFLDFIYQPISNPAGQVWGVFVEGADVTDRVKAEEQQKLLVDELNHRVKNTPATVQAIAAQTLRTTAEPAAFNRAFQARLMALSATHDLLTATSWRSVALADSLKVELHPFGADRYRFEGPELDLIPGEALALGLIFHELATNAAKYGALSAPDGCVTVSWSVIDAEIPRLELVWRESGGPAVQPPARRGFGSRLIERSLGADGSSELDFDPDGLVCRISLRLPRGEQGAPPT